MKKYKTPSIEKDKLDVFGLVCQEQRFILASLIYVFGNNPYGGLIKKNEYGTWVYFRRLWNAKFEIKVDFGD